MARSFPAFVPQLVLTGITLLANACAQGLNDPAAQSEIIIIHDTSTTSGAGAGGGGGATSAMSTSATTAEATTAVASSSATGIGACDASNNCGACGNCALAGQCQSAMSACQADQNCLALLNCLQNCTDQTCANNCATQFPAGQQGYGAMVSCIVCQSCPVSCNASAMGCGP